MAVSLVCDRLAGGRITAIGRSSTAVERARRRNAGHVASGKALIRHVDLAGMAARGQQFDNFFAIKVTLFGVRSDPPEMGVIRELIRPDGVLGLLYETPGREKADEVAHTVSTALTRRGFLTQSATGSWPSMIGIRARTSGGDHAR